MFVHPKHIAWLLIGLGAIGLIVGVLLLVRPGLEHGRQVAASPSVERAPSSTKPKSSEVKAYTVPPDSPKYISIPAINVVTARVVPLGLKPDNTIANPDNLYDAGWYKASAKPGKQGAMFIYGHVSSWQAEGLFYDLKKLHKDDTITVTNGANKQFTYRVVGTKTYPRESVDMDAVLAPVDNRPTLNLMTCGGKIIKGTSDFSERLVVFTTLAS